MGFPPPVMGMGDAILFQFIHFPMGDLSHGGTRRLGGKSGVRRWSGLILGSRGGDTEDGEPHLDSANRGNSVNSLERNEVVLRVLFS